MTLLTEPLEIIRPAFKELQQEYDYLLSTSNRIRAAIPYFGYCWWIFYLRFQYEHFEDWSNFFFGPRFLKERVGWIRRWVEQHQF